MSRVFRIDDRLAVRKRQSELPAGIVVQVWPDVFDPRASWISEETRRLLERENAPLPVGAIAEAASVSLFLPGEVRDDSTLPSSDSLAVRVLAGHGIAATWYSTPARPGGRPAVEPASPEDPFFTMMRMGSQVNHMWRLFRTRDDAVRFMQKHFATDRAAQEWAARLGVASFQELLSLTGRDRQEG